MERPAFWRMPRDHSAGAYGVENTRPRPYLPAYQQTYESRSAHSSPVRGSPSSFQHPAYLPGQIHQQDAHLNGSLGSSPAPMSHASGISPTPYASVPQYQPRSMHVGTVPTVNSGVASLDPNRESRQFMVEKEREKQAVVNQAYRSSTLVLPQPKPRHDLPTGSYLKNYADPSWREPPTRGQPIPANKMQQVMTQFQHLGPDSKVVMPYNTPLNMYSSQAINEVLEPHRSHHGDQSGHSALSAGHAQGAGQQHRPTPSPVDITMSPTYQLIQEMECTREHGPVEGHLYVVTSTTPEPHSHSSSHPLTPQPGVQDSYIPQGGGRHYNYSDFSPHPHEEIPKQSPIMTSLYKSLLQSPRI